MAEGSPNTPSGGMMKIISCPDCGKQLRFPTDRGHIRFNCSGCGSQLEWSPPGAGSSAAQSQSYGIFGGVTAQPAAQAQPTPQPAPQVAPQAPPSPQPRPAPAASDGPEPRSAGFYWLLLAAGAAYGAKWCYEAAMEDEIWATAAILLTLLVPYYTYGAILRLTRWSGGMTAAVTCVLLLSLTMVVPYLQDTGIGGVMDGLGDLTADTGDEDSHFEGRTARNTSQKDMNELMEGWE
jgi:hypothetical protein